MRGRVLLPVVLLTLMTGGCGVWTTYQNVSVPAADRTLRFGEPDNGLRLGMEVRQDTDREAAGLVIEDCTFLVTFEATPASARTGAARADAAGGHDKPYTYLFTSNHGDSITTRALEVTLTLPDATTYTLPQDDEGAWEWVGSPYRELFSLADVAEDFKSPTVATLQAKYHLDPVPDHPERWSGTIRTPPIKVKLYRMKGWSLLG